jgi:hypothetical protein
VRFLNSSQQNEFPAKSKKVTKSDSLYNATLYLQRFEQEAQVQIPVFWADLEGVEILVAVVVAAAVVVGLHRLHNPKDHGLSSILHKS